MAFNLIDRVIGAVSPEAAVRRQRARLRLQALTDAGMHYDGATKGRRAAGWRRSSTDANAALAGANATLRDTARDLIRNNQTALKAQQAIVGNTIGPGIIPQFKGATDGATRKLEDLAKAHLDTTAIDAEGRHTLYGLQALAMQTVFASGEVIIRRRRRRAEDGLPLPFQIQVLEPDFIDSSKDGDLGNGNTAIQGIEFDLLGRRVAYWLFDRHPGGLGHTLPTSRRVPASEVAHVFRTDRPGQVRGVTWLAPVMLSLHDLSDYADAQRMRQKIAACFALIEEDATADLGDGPSPLVPTKQEGDGAPQAELGPGAYIKLPPGRTMRFASPPGVDGYSEYMKVELRGIAAGLGVPYEALTGDLSEVNFSSGRMGWLEFQRQITLWQNAIIIGQMGTAVARWFTDAAAVAGVGGPVSCLWTPPRREMINPAEEVPAFGAAVRYGQMSPSEVARRNGYDPDDLFREIHEDFERFDRLGLKLDCDPRYTSRSGVTNARPAGSEYILDDGGDGDA